MNKQQMATLLIQQSVDSYPHLKKHPVKPQDSFDDLGLNFIGFSQVVTKLMKRFKVKVAMVEIMAARTIDEVAGILIKKL